MSILLSDETLAIDLIADLDRTEVLAGLSAPFPTEAVEEREGAGRRKLNYVSGETVIRRLNRVAMGWDFRITHREWTTIKRKKGEQFSDVPMFMVTGELTIAGLGTRTGIGVQVVDDNAGEDLVKGASTDALKKAATLFGMALDLSGPDLEARARNQTMPAHNERWAEAMGNLLVAQVSLGWSDAELRSFAAARMDLELDQLPAWSSMRASYLVRFAELIRAEHGA